MAINNKLSNSPDDIEKFSQGVDTLINQITKPTLASIINMGKTTEGAYSKFHTLLEETIKEVDKPILKGFLTDLTTVLSNWFESTETVCCLIQGLWSMYVKSHTNNNFKIDLGSTAFGQWIDLLVAFIDLILALLSGKAKPFAFFIPDVFKEIMNGVISAVLTLLQTTFTVIRDTIFGKLLDLIRDEATKDRVWAKCLPLSDLIRILLKYVDDYGLFADLFNKITGLVAGEYNFFKSLKELPVTMKDLEYLKWLRDVLLKMKYAYVSMDLCVDYSYMPPKDNGDTLDNTLPPASIANNANTNPSNPENLGYTFVPSDRGSILIDKNKLRENGSIPLLSNSSIREFLHKYMGYNYNQIDNIITNSSAADSIQGSNINSSNLSNLNADCPNTPDPEAIVKWALGLRDRGK
jgi:hypothetical protein